MKNLKSIFAVCGERSGDEILKRIFKQLPSSEFVKQGIYSPSEKGEENFVLFDGPKELGVMGFGMDLLKRIPLGYYRLIQTQNWLKSNPPTVLLTIDSKGFSLRLQNRVKIMNENNEIPSKIKRIHIVAPSIWAFKDGINQGSKLIEMDYLCVVLPFEPTYWKHYKGEVNFIGYFAVETLFDALEQMNKDVIDDDDHHHHVNNNSKSIKNNHLSQEFPMPNEVILPTLTGTLPKVPIDLKNTKKRQFCLRYGLNINRDIVLLAPGSRISVIKSSTPIMKQVVSLLNKRNENKFNFVVLSSKEDDARKYLFQEFPNCIIVNEEEEKNNVLLSASLSLASSGTIVTEISLFNIPVVVLYNAGGMLTRYMVDKKVRIHHATPCNIMAGRNLIPEFLFENVNQIENICKEMEELNSGKGEEQIRSVSPYLDQLVQWNGLEPIRPSVLVNKLIKKSCE